MSASMGVDDFLICLSAYLILTIVNQLFEKSKRLMHQRFAWLA